MPWNMVLHLLTQGFSIMDVSNTMMMDVNENTNLGTDDYKAASDAQKMQQLK